MFWEFVAKYLIYFYFLLWGWFVLIFSIKHFTIALLSIFVTLFCIVIIKQLTNLPRPYIRKGVKAKISPAPTDSSFPSGHTASSISLAVSVCFINPYLGTLGLIMALLLGLSRIKVMVHSKTDVIGGALLGGFCTIIINYYLTTIWVR